jgi:hypothetical protein
MCVVAVKYIKEYGWVGVKNRDRNYVVNLDIVKSKRNGIQRLYIDDRTTRWTEGLNQYGVCIISASLSVKSDEKEGDKAMSRGSKKGERSPIVSPDGLTIRSALLLKTPLEAAKYIAASELAGATYIFNKDQCYLIEGGFNIKKTSPSAKTTPRKYTYVLKEISKKDNHSVRTNHGIDIPSLGYSKISKDAYTVRNRKSSESRWLAVEEAFDKSDISTPLDVIECLSVKPHKDPFLNPVRTGDPKKGNMVTTGQLLMVASECTMHYRPIYSSVSFDYPGLNASQDNKVFFEIISSRKLLSFQEFSTSADKKPV